MLLLKAKKTLIKCLILLIFCFIIIPVMAQEYPKSYADRLETLGIKGKFIEKNTTSSGGVDYNLYLSSQTDVLPDSDSETINLIICDDESFFVNINVYCNKYNVTGSNLVTIYSENETNLHIALKDNYFIVPESYFLISENFEPLKVFMKSLHDAKNIDTMKLEDYIVSNDTLSTNILIKQGFIKIYKTLSFESLYYMTLLCILIIFVSGIYNMASNLKKNKLNFTSTEKILSVNRLREIILLLLILIFTIITFSLLSYQSFVHTGVFSIDGVFFEFYKSAFFIESGYLDNAKKLELISLSILGIFTLLITFYFSLKNKVFINTKLFICDNFSNLSYLKVYKVLFIGTVILILYLSFFISIPFIMGTVFILLINLTIFLLCSSVVFDFSKNEKMLIVILGSLTVLFGVLSAKYIPAQLIEGTLESKDLITTNEPIVFLPIVADTNKEVSIKSLEVQVPIFIDDYLIYHPGYTTISNRNVESFNLDTINKVYLVSSPNFIDNASMLFKNPQLTFIFKDDKLKNAFLINNAYNLSPNLFLSLTINCSIVKGSSFDIPIELYGVNDSGEILKSIEQSRVYFPGCAELDEDFIINYPINHSMENLLSKSDRAILWVDIFDGNILKNLTLTPVPSSVYIDELNLLPFKNKLVEIKSPEISKKIEIYSHRIASDYIIEGELNDKDISNQINSLISNGRLGEKFVVWSNYPNYMIYNKYIN